MLRFSFFLVVAALLGYLGWQMWWKVESVERGVALQQEILEAMTVSLAYTEGQLMQLQQSLGSFDMSKGLERFQKSLVQQVQSQLGEAQRRMLREESQTWVESLAKQRDKGFAALTERLADERKFLLESSKRTSEQWQQLTQQLKQNQESIQQALQETTKAWRQLGDQVVESQESALEQLEAMRAQAGEMATSLESLLQTLEEEKTTTGERYAETERRWSGLFKTLRENHEATQERYGEVLKNLEEERAAAAANMRQVERNRQREVSRLLEQARKESEREILEFCLKRPESAICRELP